VPGLVRLLVLVVAAMVMIAQPVTTWAAAGIKGKAPCCCPQPEKCECHDHGKGRDAPQLERCGSPDVRVVAPAVAVAVVPAPAPTLPEQRVIAAPTPSPLQLTDGHPLEPETPPF
jgi:hypothetical protein